MTKNLKIFTAFGTIATVCLGSLGHFVYNWSGKNYIAGLFFATNESVWEHVKLALLPMMCIFLLGAFVLKGANNFPAAAFFAMATVIISIPLAFYGYTAIAGKSILAVDIAIFVISIALGYCSAFILFRAKQRRWLNALSLIGLGAVIVCFMTFTYNAPDWFLFRQPAFA